MRRKVTITIEAEGAAFEDDPGLELADILYDFSSDLKWGRGSGFDETKLRDKNGNTCGSIAWEGDW